MRTLALVGGAALTNPRDLFGGATEDRKTILLVSGWQYHNIGDIAHTPGLLRLLNIYLPESRVILWPNHEVRAIDDMLTRNFPDLSIVKGRFDEKGLLSAEVSEAIDSADFLLHGSGPSLVGRRKVKWWKNKTDKPYGIYGVTLQDIPDSDRDIIEDATFVFTRETESLHNIGETGLITGVSGFGPDATFAMDLRNDRAAATFMQEKDLHYKEFICVVPRLRKTPYYRIYPHRDYTDEQIRAIDALNDAHKEADFGKAREAIIAWVRQTGLKVLVCPEMTYAIDIMDEMIIDPLPSDVRPHVVKKDNYWLCDEAASVYDSAFAVLSFECHSPIMAAYQGTPAFYLRQPQDTIKGQMWYDIGLDDWVFEIEETTGGQIADRLMAVYDDYPAALRYLEAAMDTVRAAQRSSMGQVRQIIAG